MSTIRRGTRARTVLGTRALLSMMEQLLENGVDWRGIAMRLNYDMVRARRQRTRWNGDTARAFYRYHLRHRRPGTVAIYKADWNGGGRRDVQKIWSR